MTPEDYDALETCRKFINTQAWDGAFDLEAEPMAVIAICGSETAIAALEKYKPGK